MHVEKRERGVHLVERAVLLSERESDRPRCPAQAAMALSLCDAYGTRRRAWSAVNGVEPRPQIWPALLMPFASDITQPPESPWPLGEAPLGVESMSNNPCCSVNVAPWSARPVDVGTEIVSATVPFGATAHAPAFVAGIIGMSFIDPPA